MISGRELAFGLMGAWRLIRNDASGLQYFDRSVSGALRSFWVMAWLSRRRARRSSAAKRVRRRLK